MDALRYYLAKRAVDRVLLVVKVVLLQFFILRVLSLLVYGQDPLVRYLRQSVPPAQDEDILFQFSQSFGLDEPLIPNQLARYFLALFTGNFGYSFTTRRYIVTEIGERLPNTLALGFLSLAVIAALGLYLGWRAASRRGKATDLLLMQASVWSYVVPSYVVGMLLLVLLSYLPRIWWGLVLFPLPPLTPPPLPQARLAMGVAIPLITPEYLWYLTLPAASLVLAGFGSWVYFTRQLMVGELGQDYVLTARAKGLTETAIMRRHVFRNVTPPVVTAIALAVPGVFSGIVITEIIFTFNGIGLYLYNALLGGDYPALQAMIFIFALVTAVTLYVADIVVAWLDPRVRLR